MQLPNAVFKKLHKTDMLRDICPTTNCLLIIPNPHHEMTLFGMDMIEKILSFILILLITLILTMGCDKNSTENKFDQNLAIELGADDYGMKKIFSGIP